jgi:hypothetical protein
MTNGSMDAYRIQLRSVDLPDKGKSLIFYAYDLDQQPGVQRASTFQAWGRIGSDTKHDRNLGIFYQDDINKQRWILKSTDGNLLSQIDAVFVTGQTE